MIYDDYVNYTNEYRNIYGDKTIVFIEVGSFFEIYGVHNDNESSGADMMAIGSLLNIQISRKNKSILENSRDNPMMAGFPNHALKKFLDVLIQNEYTCVIVEQVTPPPNPKREVTQIISPSTYLDNVNSYDTNVLMVICVEEVQHWKHSEKKSYGLGVSTVDLSTKQTTVFETHGDFSSLNEEIARVCIMYNPKELVVFSKDAVSCKLFVPSCVHNWFDRIQAETHKRFFDMVYTKNVINKVFGDEIKMIDPVEFLNMEYHSLALPAFTCLLDFVHSHNEKLVHNISKPIILQNNEELLLNNTCLTQLDIVGKQGCLSDILNHCVTAMGKRYFKQRLIQPITNTRELTRMYNITSKYIRNNIYEEIRARLKNVHDVERIINRIQINPCQWTNVYASLKELTHIQNDSVISDHLDNCIHDIESCIDVVKAGKHTLAGVDENIFVKDYDKDLDKLQDEADAIYNHYKEVHQSISSSVRLDNHEKDGLLLLTTARKFAELKKQHGGVYTSHKHRQNMLRVLTPDLEEKNNRYIELKESINTCVNEVFTKYCSTYLKKHFEHIQAIVEFIKQTDYYTTNAYNATRLGLVCPTIVDNKDHVQESFVNCKRLRHPIIEHVQKDVKYIPNDIHLNPLNRGIILYGINAAGKSSLMKSVGISVIMAQAGMFVAAEEFTYYPYHNIFTRILSHDNIYKHQSTFTVEMSELRTILQKSTNRSLVLGDELCSGTESISAISLVTAGIMHLANKNASFLFATHLHELSKLEEIRSLKNVQVKHLSVEYDRNLKRIIYDRVLKDGSGDTLYGLEVCQSLDLDDDFLNTANEIRKKLTNVPDDIVMNERSRYNSRVIKDICHICQKQAQDVHHIAHQALADSNGMINNTYHKNNAFNLVPLCKDCHVATHKNEVMISGFFHTSEGIGIVSKKKSKNKIHPHVDVI